MLQLDPRSEDLSTVLANIPRETIAMVGDAPLTIPVEVPPVIPLAYARARMNMGEDVALMWALEMMLGRDGVTAMLASAATPDQLGTITDVVISRVRGATVGTVDAGPKGGMTGSPGSPDPEESSAGPDSALPSGEHERI